MSHADFLRDRYPRLGERLRKTELASLPTPVKTCDIRIDGRRRQLSVKYDNLTGEVYGGNKVRKLEYIFARAASRHSLRIATFGAVGSNHALATALYARKAGFECTCFLSHQARTPLVAPTLAAHVGNGTELIRYGGAYASRLRVLRESLWGRHTWLIPMGGSSWLGTIGFVAAGLELAEQIDNGEIAKPDKIYVGTGTMGTAVGIAIGLALAGLRCEVNAVRVSDASITNLAALNNLANKTAAMMHVLDESVPRDIVGKTNIRMRNEFFGPGYAQGTLETDEALEFGQTELGLSLESTYTGKTVAALLSDMRLAGTEKENRLYWHTYNSAPVATSVTPERLRERIPPDFMKYIET